jgi:hypothetical protein
VADDRDPKAPHGRDDEGNPLAPFGHKANGDPRVSNRGRTAAAPKKKATPNTRAATKVRTGEETRAQLVELASVVTTPLVLASGWAPVRRRIGERQADALAGDAVIVESFAEPAVDVLMFAARSRPGLLAWMDKAEENAPLIMAAKIAGGLAKAIVENHLNPDPRLSAAGRTLVQVRAARYAEAIEREAAELGIVPDAAEMRAA